MNKKCSIMIVDDDESLHSALRDFLSAKGHDCLTFSCAEAALTHLANNSCEVILTDIIMPGMKGLELTERAKRMRPDINVIVMTGFIDDFSYDEVIAAGASDFIKKPFNMNELLMRIKHVQLQEKLRTMTITDELTGLPNRRGFFVLAEQQVKAATRAGREQVLLFADLDDFKSINDTLGHHVGDQALMAMAAIFRQSFRDSDIIARMSGDEFAILLLDTTENNVKDVHERLRKNIEHYNARKNGSFQLSVSVGIASLDPREPRSLDELLRQADAGMYEQKQRKKSGRRGDASIALQ